ncbi:unnamed protein product, partial [Allacma fusca]
QLKQQPPKELKKIKAQPPPGHAEKLLARVWNIRTSNCV